MKKNNFAQLVILIECNVFLFFLLVFLGRLMATAFVYFKIWVFLFDWKGTTLLSLKKGFVIGLTLGMCFWLKAKLQELKERKESNK